MVEGKNDMTHTTFLHDVLISAGSGCGEREGAGVAPRGKKKRGVENGLIYNRGHRTIWVVGWAHFFFWFTTAARGIRYEENAESGVVSVYCSTGSSD